LRTSRHDVYPTIYDHHPLTRGWWRRNRRAHTLICATLSPELRFHRALRGQGAVGALADYVLEDARCLMPMSLYVKPSRRRMRVTAMDRSACCHPVSVAKCQSWCSLAPKGFAGAAATKP